MISGSAQDGALNDTELNVFQVKCFSAPLQPEEIIGVKQVVAEKMPQVRVTPLDFTMIMSRLEPGVPPHSILRNKNIFFKNIIPEQFGKGRDDDVVGMMLTL